MLKEGRLRRLEIDQSGLGMQLAEELVRRHGAQVEPITITHWAPQSFVKWAFYTRSKIEIVLGRRRDSVRNF